MNEVIGNQAIGNLPTRAASSSKVGDSTQTNAVVTGNTLPESTPENDQGVEIREQDAITDVRQAVARINEFVQREQRNLQFSVDDETGTTVIRVVDRASGELIRQIPDEVFLDLAKEAILRDEQISLINVRS